MSEYELIDLCHRSGQMTEEQWQKHLEDADFAAWKEAVTAACREATAFAQANVE